MAARVNLSHGLLLVAVVASGIVCFPVTRAYFFSDDFLGFLTIVDRGGWLFVIQQFGGHLLLVRNATIWLVFALWGLHSEPSGWLVWLTHLVNVALVFRIVRVSTGNAWLGSLGAALWGTASIHSETIGWFSNYGQVQAATMLLVFLERVLSCSPSTPISPARAVFWAALLWIGAACIGAGIGVAMASPAVILLLIPGAHRRRALRNAFAILPVAVMVSYYGFRWLYRQFEPPTFFDIVFIAPPNQIADMLVNLAGVGVSALLHPFCFPKDATPIRLDAWAIWVFAVPVLAGFACGDWAARRRQLAYTVLAASAYGIIALGRASSYAQWHVSMSDAAHPPRYHYLPMLPLTLLFFDALAAVCRKARQPVALPALALAAWAALAVLSYVRGVWKLDERAAARTATNATLAELDRVIDAARPGETVYIPLTPEPYVPWGVLNYELAPGTAAVFAVTHRRDKVRGRWVRFVAPKEKRDAFSNPKHRRFSRLIVPYAAVAVQDRGS